MGETLCLRTSKPGRRRRRTTALQGEDPECQGQQPGEICGRRGMDRRGGVGGEGGGVELKGGVGEDLYKKSGGPGYSGWMMNRYVSH